MGKMVLETFIQRLSCIYTSPFAQRLGNVPAKILSYNSHCNVIIAYVHPYNNYAGVLVKACCALRRDNSTLLLDTVHTIELQ